MTPGETLIVIGAVLVAAGAVLTSWFRRTRGLGLPLNAVRGTGIIPSWVSLAVLVGWVLVVIGVGVAVFS